MDPQHVTKLYTQDGVSIVWKSGLCIHSGICARGLPAVFRPRERPWVQLSGADLEAVKRQVEQCPSGALSWKPAQP